MVQFQKLRILAPKSSELFRLILLPLPVFQCKSDCPVISWFLSPLLSGLVSVIFYLFIDHAVLRRRHPLRCGLILLPVLYFVCVAVNIFAVLYNGSEFLGFDKLPPWVILLITFSTASVVAAFVHFIMGPRLKKRILSKFHFVFAKARLTAR
ncbi:unnamed protein product [Gongylonema pulchrum]|uniref:Transmembrane protein n=1 Tax=Gongylonema pulchrum TaxID=637853 RepID=A0A183EJ09_9BILA|nr:unnamed protein product [Gongylonema pulchrum]